MMPEDKLRLETPKYILDFAQKRYGSIDFDGAATWANRVSDDLWSAEDDADRHAPWHGSPWEHVWINPPYEGSKKLLGWVEKACAYQIVTRSQRVTMCLPFDPTTELGRTLIWTVWDTGCARPSMDGDWFGLLEDNEHDPCLELWLYQRRVKFLLDGKPSDCGARFTTCLFSWPLSAAANILGRCAEQSEIKKHDPL